MAPKVSVIMPVYNAAEYVGVALESILNQTFTDYEFLIIDDGSQDETVPIINAYADNRIKLFQNEGNLGSLLARNRMMEEASGDYLAFQDADDIAEAHRLHKQIDLLEGDSSVALCGTYYRAIDQHGQTLKEVSLPAEPDTVKDEFKRRCPVLFPSTMLRRNIYDELGGFREYFKDKGNYDYDWLVRIAENYKVSNVPELLYNRRILPISNSKLIGNPDKIFGDRSVRFLQSQRGEDGRDALMGYKVDQFDRFVREQRTFVKNNPQYYYHWQMDTFMSYGMYKDALKNALRAVQVNPGIFRSYRDAFYIFRQIIKNINIF